MAQWRAGGRMTRVLVPAAVGDVLDRITILALKAERLRAPKARAAAGAEQAELEAALTEAGVDLSQLHDLANALAATNTTLWDLEEAMRTAHNTQDDAQIASLSRAIVTGNAERSRLKAEINAASGSALQELKDYASGTGDQPL